MKIYVHNYFSTPFFITLAHNSTNRVFDLDENGKVGNVTCKYKRFEFEFVFNPILNDNSDGYHLIDFFSILRNHSDYDNFKDIDLDQEGNNPDIQIIKRIIKLLFNKKNWIFFYLRTEKILSKIDIPDLKYTTDITKYSYLQKMVIVDDLLNQLNNHIIISDNVFLNEVVESKYSNYYHTFTNSIYNLLLAGIPFISTHNYPLDIIQKVLKVDNHPFYEESKKFAVNPKGFTEFVDNFLQNFEENFELCLGWSLSTKKILLDYINLNNDLLQLFVDGKINTEKRLYNLL